MKDPEEIKKEYVEGRLTLSEAINELMEIGYVRALAEESLEIAKGNLNPGGEG